MDGLEITEVDFSFLSSVIDYRIESEYFEKKYLVIDSILINVDTINFTKAAKIINGRPYSSSAFNNAEGVYISKIGDVTNKREILSWERVNQNEFDLQKGKLLNDNDILITLTGDPPDVGKTNMVDCNGQICSWNQRVAKIERICEKYISNNVLYAVLSSELCRTQMERFAKGIRQRNLGNECFDRVQLPLFSELFQQILDRQISLHKQSLSQARDVYVKTEELLLHEFGISNFSFTDKEISIKSLSSSFTESGRLDAEYYQPKYDGYEYQLKTTDTVNSLCRLNDNNYTPKEGVEYRYIELSNIGVYGNIADVETIVGEDLPSRARRQVKKGQVIVASVEGSLQSCALITDEYNDALCSTGFYVLDSDSINAETLLILFKSEPIQELLKQRCSGTILTAINKDELLTMPLPQVNNDILQRQIAEKVQQSFALRRKSEQLLDNAKQAVEMAIEQGEAKAIAWLKEKEGEC